MPATKVGYTPSRTDQQDVDRNLQAIGQAISAIGDRLNGALQMAVFPVATGRQLDAGSQIVRYVGGGGDVFILPSSHAQGAALGQVIAVMCDQAAAVLKPAGQDTVNGLQSLVVPPRAVVVLTSDSGGHWTAVGQVFGASGAGHGVGLVPDPGASAGATRFLREDGTWANVPSPPAATDVRVFTASATWTKPAGALNVDAILIGCGGPGGSGRRGAAATFRTGGGGGGGGGVSAWRWPAAILGATEAVTVGAGTPGVGAGADNTDGNPGTAGADTSFGAWLRAGAGAAGGAGTSGAAGGGGAGGTGNAGTGGAGGAGSNGSTAASAATAAAGRAGGGGGGGGGLSNANAAQAATAGATGTSTIDRPSALAGGGAGTAGAGSPGAGASTNESAGGGGGGGGGAGGASGGGAGAAAGNYGGGGGGGGASLNGTASGAGGAGGAGLAIIVSYF